MERALSEDMPVMDGWQFLARQTEDAALAAIPVVVLSASSDGAKASRFPSIAGRFRMVAYYPLPEQTEEEKAWVLEVLVSSVCYRHEEARKAREQAAERRYDANFWRGEAAQLRAEARLLREQSRQLRQSARTPEVNGRAERALIP